MPIAIRRTADESAFFANAQRNDNSLPAAPPERLARSDSHREPPRPNTSTVATIAAALASAPGPAPAPREIARPLDRASRLPLARPAEMLRYDAAAADVPVPVHTQSPEPASFASQQSPFAPLPFNPSMPDIASCAPARVYRAGDDIALFLRSPSAIAARSGLPSAVRYPLVLAVVSRATHMPLFMVTLEHGPFDTAWLCTFGTDGVHRNLGAMSIDEDQFFAHAASIVSTELGQMLVELPMPQPPAAPPSAHPAATPHTQLRMPLPEQHAAQSAKPPCLDLGQFVRMLDQEHVPGTDPTVGRMQDLMRNVAVYLNAGTGTDAEAAHLEHELQWAAMHFPPRQCEALIRSVRAASPTYRQRLERMKQAHFNLVTTGNGAVGPLLNEIAALEAAGVLSAPERTTLQNALRPQPAVVRPQPPNPARGTTTAGAHAAARPLPARPPSQRARPWWRRLLG